MTLPAQKRSNTSPRRGLGQHTLTIDIIGATTGEVSPIVLLQHAAAPIRIGLRGPRPDTIEYAGRRWTNAHQITDNPGGPPAYCYIAAPC